ncbi:Predicted esterase [uncultured Roseburia sp.]|uniref:Alpha/beta hydrolase n=1 Tax=Brotonthovivens ammoniilytica TaxID=2981725 RepID=A0ABT2TG03_9FIRM|nr:alpha/beta hydrolase [Brotonthovivens ammoniilytica]MCU6761107.1 alpha/beta hydrolase [Brotonthovivens ammoniilytica]SCI19083.1 Predicted esterase [uncultured Roseburia sp.]
MIIFLIMIIILCCLMILAAYISYRRIFYSGPRPDCPDHRIPDTDQYRPYKEEILRLLSEALALPYESVAIKSYDGLTLYGKYYHVKDHAPLQIMFHGYRTPLAERDFEGGMQISRQAGCNFLLVDQRAHGKSQGHITTFGIRERRDCLSWITYALERFGKETKITLFGISMGAATVLMAADLGLPENVAGIVADCGYTSPEAIIKSVIGSMGLPGCVYFFVRLGAVLFAHLNLSESDAVNAVKQCRIPVLFIHGEDDRYVPCKMTKELYNACLGEKYLLTVPGAGHGMSFYGNRKEYVRMVQKFVMEKSELKNE